MLCNTDFKGKKFLQISILSFLGGLAIGTPGQIKGLWEAKQKFGNPQISWESLIQPSIEMCYTGIPVSWTNAVDLKTHQERIKSDPGMREIFLNPSTGNVWNYEDIYTWPNLGQTYEKIAKRGSDEFYYGETMKMMVEDLKSVGAIITEDDFLNYEYQICTQIGRTVRLYTVLPEVS